MGILTSTFGAEFSASINLNDLEGWIAGQVESQAQNVANIEAQFSRSFSVTEERMARFRESTAEFNLFVTGFTYEEEMQWYRSSATMFYGWVIIFLIKAYFHRVPNLMYGLKKFTLFNFHSK